MTKEEPPTPSEGSVVGPIVASLLMAIAVALMIGGAVVMLIRLVISL